MRPHHLIMCNCDNCDQFLVYSMTWPPIFFLYFSERISRERELVEERCERRLEILKNLVGKTAGDDDCVDSTGIKSEVLY